MYEIEFFPLGAFQCNCSLVHNLKDKKTVIVDPGNGASQIIARLEARSFEVAAIWLTHAHIDHVEGLTEVFEYFKSKGQTLPIYLHPKERVLYENINEQARLFSLPPFDLPPETVDIQLSDRYEFLPDTRVLFCPGHSPGSCALFFKAPCRVLASRAMLAKEEEEREFLVIGGDALFRGSIGRTDLYMGDFNTLEKSIVNQFYTLDESTLVLPGHGPVTTIAREKRENPFVNGDSKP